MGRGRDRRFAVTLAAFLLASAGCTSSKTTNCKAAADADARGIENLPPGGEGAQLGHLYRVQGILAAQTESSIISMDSRQAFLREPGFDPMTLCARALPTCQEFLLSACRPPKDLSRDYTFFCLVDAIVRFDGFRPGALCPSGLVTIEQVVKTRQIGAAE